MQELHSDLAFDTIASHTSQKRRRGASKPAIGANTTPLNTADNQHPVDPTQPVSVDEQSAAAQQPPSSETAYDLHAVSWFDDFAEAYAGDSDFAIHYAIFQISTCVWLNLLWTALGMKPFSKPLSFLIMAGHSRLPWILSCLIGPCLMTMLLASLQREYNSLLPRPVTSLWAAQQRHKRYYHAKHVPAVLLSMTKFCHLPWV